LLLLVLTISLPAAGLAACGGGPSKASYLTKADAICEPANRSVAAVAKPTAYPELGTAGGTLLSANDGQLVQLRNLDTPSGSKDEIDAVWSALAALSQSAKALQQGAVAQDRTAAGRALGEISTRAADAGAKATAYGFGACGVGMKAGTDQLVAAGRPIIKAAYVADAENICQNADKVLGPSKANKNDPVALGRQLSSILPILDKLVADLKALPAPPGDEAAVAELIAGQEKEVATYKALRDALLAKSPTRVLLVVKDLDQILPAAEAKLVAYGLKACASSKA